MQRAPDAGLPFSAYVPHSSNPSRMSSASPIRVAICTNINSGVLARNPLPASANELSGSFPPTYRLAIALVLVRAHALPTDVYKRQLVHYGCGYLPCHYLAENAIVHTGSFPSGLHRFQVFVSAATMTSYDKVVSVAASFAPAMTFYDKVCLLYTSRCV